MEDNLNNRYVKEAVTVLNQGGIIIYPTDTAFAIGCRINNKKAIEKLFNIKRRPLTQAVPVLMLNSKMVEDYLLPLTDNVRQLMKQYWPGALTIVYPCFKNMTPPLVRGGGNNLGVRIPNHPIPLQLIRNIGVPLLAPSANFHQYPTPYQLSDIDDNLIKLVDYLIPGKCGGLRQTSTIIDCTKRSYKVIRQGAQKIDKHFLR